MSIRIPGLERTSSGKSIFDTIERKNSGYSAQRASQALSLTLQAGLGILPSRQRDFTGLYFVVLFSFTTRVHFRASGSMHRDDYHYVIAFSFRKIYFRDATARETALGTRTRLAPVASAGSADYRGLVRESVV
jgi:hypothetical protein